MRRLLMRAAVAVAMFAAPSAAAAQTFVQPFVALVDGGRAGCAAPAAPRRCEISAIPPASAPECPPVC